MIGLVSDFYKCKNTALIYTVFCSSLYGIELFNYSHTYMSDLYVAWRKVIRRIFKVPYRTHNDIVIKLGGDIVLGLDRRIFFIPFN